MRWMFFIHVASVAFWLGGTATLYLLYRKSLRLASSDGVSLAYDTTRTVIKGILNPSALLVLLTGIVMLMQMGLAGQAKPFWLAFMEQFGGMVALISVVVLSWQMRRLNRAASDDERVRRWRILNLMLVGVGIGVILTIFVVALRF